MSKVEQYRQVFNSFRTLCAEGKQPSSFRAYCKSHGVNQSLMPYMLKNEYEPIKTLPGYTGMSRIGKKCRQIYEEFRDLCAEGRQPGTFMSYYMKYGITFKQMDGFQRRNKLTLAELPGYTGSSHPRSGRCQEVPFEDVIFKEAGFLPVDSGNVITVKVDGHIAVSFPAETDIDVVAKFICKMGKEAGHVGS